MADNKENKALVAEQKMKLDEAVRLLNEISTPNKKSNYLLIGYDADRDSNFCAINGMGNDIEDAVIAAALECEELEKVLAQANTKLAICALAKRLGVSNKEES